MLDAILKFMPRCTTACAVWATLAPGAAAWAQSGSVAAAPVVVAQSNGAATSGAALVPATTPTAPTPLRSSAWHFQATYGVSAADLEAPYWNTSVDPVKEAQRSTSGVLTQTRYGHSVETVLSQKQSVRWGLALVNEQMSPSTGWASSLVKNSKAPEWRTWGVGLDLFLVRHNSPSVDFDAGLQADYLLSGVATLSSNENANNSTTALNRLEQKSGWRVAFSGGIGGMYLGPFGIIARVSGYVLQSTFKGHTQALRAQGLQFQLGADLALGRGEP